MANELGSALVIPQSLLNKLDEADKKIIKIAQDSEQTATTFNMAFKNIGVFQKKGEWFVSVGDSVLAFFDGIEIKG